MSDDYTPTTEEVRGDYANFQLPAEGGDFRDEYADGLAEFDRWMADMLAAHDAEKRAEWEDAQSRSSAVQAMSAYDDGHTAGYAEGYAAAVAEQGDLPVPDCDTPESED